MAQLEQRQAGHLGATLLACALVMGAFALGTARLTAGLEHWTFEALRRGQASRGAMRFPSMELVDASGRWRQWPDSGPGEVLLVDFIYAGCASVCQALGDEFFQAQQQILRDGSGVRLLSVSIDPANDTPSALAAYGLRHHADARLWTLAAPATVEEGTRIRQAVGVVAVPDGAGGFAHNGTIHIVDPHGRVAGIFDTADWQRALTLARQLEGTRR